MYLGRMLRPLRSSSAADSASSAQALAVERNAHRFYAQPGEPGERALIGFLLDQDGVAGRQQDAVDQIDGLQRAGSDQDLVRAAGDAGIALELAHQEFAQRPVPERSAREPIGGERRAFAPEHRRRGRNETVDRQLRGVVVAADEIVLGKPGPFGRRRRQPGPQQRREIERSEGHVRVSLAAKACRVRAVPMSNANRRELSEPVRFGRRDFDPYNRSSLAARRVPRDRAGQPFKARSRRDPASSAARFSVASATIRPRPGRDRCG